MRTRIATVVATVVFVILGVAGRLASAAPRRVYLVDLACLALVYLLPATYMTSAREVLRRWPLALACVVAGTVLWDAGLSAIGARPFLADWFIVYPSSVAVFGSLLLASGGVVTLVAKLLHVDVGRQAGPGASCS